MVPSAPVTVRPNVRSQARNVKVADPLKLGLGRKRMRLPLVASSKRAAALVGAPKSIHCVPPARKYCQVPLLLSTPVTAMPRGAGGRGNVAPLPDPPVTDTGLVGFTV